MTIIPLDIAIERKQGKKLYRHLHTGQVLTKPVLPKDWQHIVNSVSQKQAPSHAIRCDDDLIVIDCDDLDSTDLVDNKLIPSRQPEHYIVISDKGFKHYYFSPTDYYRKSLVYKQSRLSLGKIDLLHGKALVFAPCEYNKTKAILSGSLEQLTPIPDNIVDLLVSQLKATTLAQDVDYRPLKSYLAPIIEQSLALYARTKLYVHLQGLMQLITPSRYIKAVLPDYHPDRIADGDGTDYLYALSAKIASDPSISEELHRELITLIATELWTDPLSPAKLSSFWSIFSQRYPNGQKMFVYEPNATTIPLASINGYEYMPVYRTLAGQYILAKPHGGAEVISNLSLFKQAMASKNYDLIINNTKVNLDNNIGMKKLNDVLLTLSLINLPYRPPGVFEDNGSLYYNTYIPNKYLGIIRGEHKQDVKYLGPDSHQNITMIIKNIMADNDPDHYNKFIQFLSHKLKTLEYSPIVFQVMGNRGIGKSQTANILRMLTEAVAEISFSASNSQFNAHTEGMMFLIEEEGLVSSNLINKVKALSGNRVVNIEKKGQDITVTRNIATYFFNTNKTTPMAETTNDRRFVTLSGFKAQKLAIKDLDVKIALELEAFALLLRDTKLVNDAIYLDANAWHDEVHYANFEETQSKIVHKPNQVANLVYKLSTLSGQEIHDSLTEIFGYNYHYLHNKKSHTIISIPLNKTPPLIRQSDKVPLTHEITREHLKGVELDQHISKNTNRTNAYGTMFYKLDLTLELSQLNEFLILHDIIEEIEV